MNSKCAFAHVRSFGHEWRVEVHAAGNKVCVSPSDGHNYITMGVFGKPFAWGWRPGERRYSRRPKRIERLKKSCQIWCDKKNAKAAKGKAKLKAAGLPTEDNCMFCGEEHTP